MRTVVAAILCLAPFFTACDAREKTALPANTGGETRFPLRVGAATIRARLAVTEIESRTGLMGTPRLADDEGMIFLYRENGPLRFWMQNVPYDIDIGFFTPDGRLDEILRLRANDATIVTSRADKLRYALEAPAGWYEKNALTPGAALDIAELAKAVTARGFRTGDFVPPAK